MKQITQIFSEGESPTLTHFRPVLHFIQKPVILFAEQIK